MTEENDTIKGYKNIANGYYAVEDPLDGVLKFYKVVIPDTGKYKGYTFLSVQASADFFSVKNKWHRYKILDKIAEDPVAAMKRYGRELGHCGMCGRTLTDTLSREIGIGPVCREKL
jgi:hypothetical protein